jgi:hypothetical protein
MKDAVEIKNFPGYFVTNSGKVFSSKRGGEPVEINGSYWQGYRKVGLSVNGKTVTISVHRLVAMTFLKGPPPGYNVVNHIDGNKSNNDVSNLEWTNHAGNMKHFKETLSPTYVERSKNKKQEDIEKKLKLIQFAHDLYKEDTENFHKICTTALSFR